MTILATTPRARPVSHAFVVPVVREVVPLRGAVGSSAW
jgi:hypothetical protein